MNSRKNIKRILFVAGLFGISMLTVGCQAQKKTLGSYSVQMQVPQPVVSRSNCVLEETNRFRQAMNEARKDLMSESCYPSFDRYLDGMLKIAAGDPDILRRKDFSEFLIWSAERGIISKMQAKEYYNRYFSTTFISLSDEYNVCSQCQNQEEIERSIYEELLQKKEGMSEACNDKKGYNQARSHYDSLLLFLDATCTACSEG